MRSNLKAFPITDAKTSLFLLNELIWIEGDNRRIFSSSLFVFKFGCLKVVNAWTTLSVSSTQYLHMDLFRVNLCLTISPTLLLKCGHVCAKNLLGDRDGRWSCNVDIFIYLHHRGHSMCFTPPFFGISWLTVQQVNLLLTWKTHGWRIRTTCLLKSHSV